jgi:hypothetical protein
MGKRLATLRDVLRAESDASLLWALATAKDPDWQRRICAELGRRGSREATTDLLRILREAQLTEDWRLVEAAADALGRIGAQDAGTLLADLLANVGLPLGVRDSAAFALARLAFRPAIPALLASLADPHKTVRLCAVAALAAINDPTVASRSEWLIEAESDAEVRLALQRLVSDLRSRAGESQLDWIANLVGKVPPAAQQRTRQPVLETVDRSSQGRPLPKDARESWSDRLAPESSIVNERMTEPIKPWRNHNLTDSEPVVRSHQPWRERSAAEARS